MLPDSSKLLLLLTPELGVRSQVLLLYLVTANLARVSQWGIFEGNVCVGMCVRE